MNKLYRRFVKRILDFTVAIIALILLSPLLAIVAILVKNKLGSPVIFKQPRPGLNEKIFTMYKFRTMTDETDAQGNLLSDELRLTKFGKFLRSTSIDELPELVNVIRGEMSLVGPRPLLVEYLEHYNADQKHRHDVRPGITGLAQISGRNLLEWNQRFVKDIDYVNTVSFIGDIKIIVMTLKKVFVREGISSATSTTMTVFKGNQQRETSI